MKYRNLYIKELEERKIKAQLQLFRIRELLSTRDRNGKQTGMKDGFVYLIINRAFPGWVKLGMAVDYEKRLKSYNTYSPADEYQILSVEYVSDRRLKEKVLLRKFKERQYEQKGEWFKLDEEKAFRLFQEYVLK